MTNRRSTAPRKRATPVATARPAAPVATVEQHDEDTADPVVASNDPRKISRDILADFDNALRDTASIAEDEREALVELFSTSLNEVVESGAYAKAPSEVDWKSSIDALRQFGVDARDDNGSLARQLSNAVATLEQRSTAVTLEFSRRMQADGQESALTWLKKQSDSTAKDAASDKAATKDSNHPVSPALRTEVTKSRSRRLRGPPK